MKIEEITKGQTVYHPLHGEGQVMNTREATSDLCTFVYVTFGDYDESFWGDEIDQIHPEPVAVVPTKELEAMKDLIQAQNWLLDLFMEDDHNNPDWLKGKEVLSKINQLESLLNKEK